jgi:hypothetical protein
MVKKSPFSDKVITGYKMVAGLANRAFHQCDRLSQRKTGTIKNAQFQQETGRL